MSSLLNVTHAVSHQLSRITLAEEVDTALMHVASVLLMELVQPADLEVEFLRFTARLLRGAAEGAGDHDYSLDLDGYADTLEPTPDARQVAIDCMGSAVVRLRRSTILPEARCSKRYEAALKLLKG